MNMQRPQIALIDLDAPSLRQENKLHHAAQIFTWLKSQGLARWARYRGTSLQESVKLYIDNIQDMENTLCGVTFQVMPFCKSWILRT
jgi:hypothetical protein